MRLKYIGPHDGVLVPLPDGREIEVKRDDVVDVPDDEHAARLLEQQSNWQRAPQAPRPKKAEAEATDTALKED